MSSYKERFYSKYVSAHNARLYGERSIEDIRKQFPIWDYFYSSLLPAGKTARVADLGCGEGGLVHWLHEEGYMNALGVDVSGEQVELGKKLSIKNIFHEDLLSFLKKQDGTLDCILLRDVLGHLTKEEVLTTLDAAHAALSPRGTIIIKTPNAESPMSGRLRYADFTHDVSFTGDSLRQVLLVSGFEDVELYSTPPVPHGMKSAIRSALWVFIEVCLRVYRLIEAGNGCGIYTQNVIASAKKK